MRAKALFVMILGLLSLDARAQISGYSSICLPDSFSFNRITTASFRLREPKGTFLVQAHPPQPLLMDADMTVQHLPFFCRQEYKFERASGIPLRMRLGSVQQTDWLEQKVRTTAPR